VTTEDDGQVVNGGLTFHRRIVVLKETLLGFLVTHRNDLESTKRADKRGEERAILLAMVN
jgi:hypothetical protein